jgi:ribosome-interacting GTPase 1
VKVGTRGKGNEIKWVDVQDLPVTKEFVKFKKETTELIESLKSELAETRKELKKAELSNVKIVEGLISR